MRLKVVFVGLFALYLLLLPGLTEIMRNRSSMVKLGYVPHPQMIRLFGGEFAPLLAEFTTLRVVIYFGTLVDKWLQQVRVAPEYPNMYRAMLTASEVDPYNQDIYYFSQAIFTWEVGRAADVNRLLEHGMKYRTWDPWLPFYAGFNSAYFLKDYAAAARYMEKAALLSGDPLRTNLAARFFYESNQTEIGLTFLNMVISKEKNPAVRQTYELRRQALLAVAAIETANVNYTKKHGVKATRVGQLVDSGFLTMIPEDPYGGEFYLDDEGRARSSSKFARN